ncbi:MAG: TRAP transporter small permease [Alphaproteobacteria bacterium]|jgi:TRAP-type C4-dicarboxylate transport system permease small subunit|nr:TRAP transporter small permease [Alphaproteobacteria bacterium]
MTEILALVFSVAVVAGFLTLTAAKAESIQRHIERLLTHASVAIILFVMAYVLAEVVMRYAFNSPLPGHLEGAELLLPMIVFFAVSYTQSRNGHVGMTLVVDMLSPQTRRITDIVTLVLSMLTCAVLAYFGAKQAYIAWDIDDVTMTPPYWPIWPSAAVVPIGYLLLSIRMCLQALRIAMPGRFPEPVAEDSELPSAFE